MMLLASAYAAFADVPSATTLRANGISTFFYVNNWQTIYWSDFTPSAFSHTWSLSIEEQWYLAWPLLLGGLVFVARGRPGRLAALVGLLGVASAVLMAHFHATATQSRAFFGTDTRAWELLAGALLAVVIVRYPGGIRTASPHARAVREILGTLGAAFLLFAFATFSDTDRTLYPGARILVVISVMVLIAAVVDEHSPRLRRLLGWRPLVALGLISYGLYLYHVPLFLWLSAAQLGIDGLPLFRHTHGSPPGPRHRVVHAVGGSDTTGNPLRPAGTAPGAGRPCRGPGRVRRHHLDRRAQRARSADALGALVRTSSGHDAPAIHSSTRGGRRDSVRARTAA